MTTVKKGSRRGLLAAAIMLPLILGFYSLANAATPVSIPCGSDIDQKINADPKDTATRFVLGANCSNPFVASATIVPSDGDEVACAVAPTFKQLTPVRESDPNKAAYDPTASCTVAGSASVENVFRPIGKGGTTATVRFEGIKITGGNYTGSTGTGAAIAEGSMTNTSSHYGIEVMNNEAAGILSAKGTFDRVELTKNTLNSNALGVIGSGMKARDEVEVRSSYVHDTQGNGIWCDNSCHDSSSHPNGFYVHDNLVVNNGRAGIRIEDVPDDSAELYKARIEYNELHGNSPDEKRGAISVRDAQNVLIQNNIFGANARSVAIVASDSGRRTPLKNINIVKNILNGEIIKGCELSEVHCDGPIP